MLDVLYTQEDALAAAQQIKELVGDSKQIEGLRAECAAIRAWSKNNYLPLLWGHYRSHRQILLRVIRSLRLETSTGDESLRKAVAVVLSHAAKSPRYIEPSSVDLAFASDRWRKLVLQDSKGGIRVDRRQLEVCVFSYLMAELRAGDITVWGSESFADHREQLLPKEECRKLLARYCERLNLPATAKEFAGHLKNALLNAAQQTDASFVHNDQLSINAKGEPVVQRTKARQIPVSAVNLQATVVHRMPVRNLLDVLVNVESWTNFTRPFPALTPSWIELWSGICSRFLLWGAIWAPTRRRVI
jgi:hypothetical protein